MFFVHILVSVPLARQERVLFTDDLPVKKRHLGTKQRWFLEDFEDFWALMILVALLVYWQAFHVWQRYEWSLFWMSKLPSPGIRLWGFWSSAIVKKQGEQITISGYSSVRFLIFRYPQR